MKRLLMVPIIAIMALSFCLGGVAYAQEDETTLSDPGTTPDSPFYFMDKWGKQLSLMFTFNAGEKADKALRYADERMAEMDAMMARNKIKEAIRAEYEYQWCLQKAIKNMEQARINGVDVSEKVALMAEKHLGYLCDNTGNAPEDARMLMTQTLEMAIICQETALKNMAQDDPEKAAQFNLQLMTRQLNRIRVQAEAAKGEAVQARLEVYNRLGNLGEEISRIAWQFGKGVAVDQIIGMATAQHLEVLTQVQQRVQGQAQQAVETTIQNRWQTHERAVERLHELNQLGPVPEEPLMPGGAMSDQTGQNVSSGGAQKGR